ncbi:MAG: sigma-70 family RNA polymerase sigma factor [Bacteroidota bacterium]
MNYSESQLIERWAQGRRDAAELLIRKYYPYAYTLGLGFCKGNKELANNAVQLFFGRLSQNLPKIYQEDRAKFDSIQSNFQAYLLTGIRNNAKEQIRSLVRHKDKITPISNVPPQKKDPNSDNDAFERKNVLEYILSFLPTSQQHVYQLYLEGYSYEEIAKQTKLNKAQVRGRIERSNKALKGHRALIKQLLTQ